MVIWKYTLEITDRQTIELPAARYFLHAGQQGEGPYGDLCLWFMIDPDAKKVTKTILIYGTGHPLRDEDEISYLASVVMGSGQLVWHVFEEK